MEQAEQTLYDTHAAVRRLTSAGMPEPQAEAVAREYVQIIERKLATKDDIEKLSQATQADIEGLRLAIQAEIEKAQLATQAEIEKAQLATQAEIEKARLATQAEIAAMRGNLIIWVAGSNMATIGIVAGVVTSLLTLL